MTTEGVFIVVALIVLIVGTILILRSDANKIAQLVIESGPNRLSSLNPIRIMSMGAVFVVFAVAGSVGVVTVYQPIALQEANATRMTIVTAAKDPSIAFSSPASQKLDSLLLSYTKLVKSRKAVVEPSDLDVRDACNTLFANSATRLTQQRNANLGDTESRLIEYCLPTLTAAQK